MMLHEPACGNIKPHQIHRRISSYGGVNLWPSPGVVGEERAIQLLAAIIQIRRECNVDRPRQIEEYRRNPVQSVQNRQGIARIELASKFRIENRWRRRHWKI